MSLVSNKNKKVFLYSNRVINVNSKVDIILSPEFYWVRIFEIPVKNITQAKHVLPTLFEDIVENTNELSYQVIKLEDNKYLCFAYSNKKIFEQIKKSKIPLSLVNMIYFAQNECTQFKQFTVDEYSFLYTDDNILVKVPTAFVSNAVNLDENIEQIDLSSNNVNIKLYNNVLDIKQIYLVVSIILFVSLINFYKMFDYKSETNKLDEKIKKIKSFSNLPSSSIQTNVILKKYDDKIAEEIKKRDALEYVLKNKDFQLKSLELEKNDLILSFINSDKQKVENYLSKKYKITSSNVNNIVLNIRIKLWID